MIFKNSRYANGLNVYLDEDKDITFLDFPTTFIPSELRDHVYQFKAGDDIGILANRLYGSHELKWLILYANPNFNTEFDIKAGDIVVLPNPEGVSKYVDGSE